VVGGEACICVSLGFEDALRGDDTVETLEAEVVMEWLTDRDVEDPETDTGATERLDGGVICHVCSPCPTFIGDGVRS
jgi:hypothetical protein